MKLFVTTARIVAKGSILDLLQLGIRWTDNPPHPFIRYVFRHPAKAGPEDIEFNHRGTCTKPDCRRVRFKASRIISKSGDCRLNCLNTISGCSRIASHEEIAQHEAYISEWGPHAGVKYFPNGIALLRLDGDLYRSTKVCLDNLLPLVSPGGWVIVDDFGLTWERGKRCLKAVCLRSRLTFRNRGMDERFL